jgi:hypothetical protein
VADEAHANEEASEADAAANAIDEAPVFEVVEAPMISDDEDNTGRTDDVDTAHPNDIVSNGALPPDGDTIAGVANENENEKNNQTS